MLKYYRRYFNFACASLDLVALVTSFFLAYYFRRDAVPLLVEGLARKPVFGLGAYVPVLVLSGIVVLGALFAAGAYRLKPSAPLSSLFFLNARALLAALLLTLALAFLLKMTFLSRLFLGTFLLLFLLLSTAAKHWAALWFRRGAARGKYLRVLVLVGTGQQARQVAELLQSRPELGLKLHGFLDVGGVGDPDGTGREGLEALGLSYLGGVDFLPALLEREVIDGVVFAVAARSLGSLEELFLACEDQGVETLVAANFFPHLIAQVQLERLETLPLLSFSTVPHNQFALFVKRVVDAAGAGLGLVLLSPLFLLVAALVKLGSRGPVFFAQERVGLNGRRFRCLKFRTMVADAEKRLQELQVLNEVDGPVFKMKHDPRVTRVGSLLRKTSIDELPQLWNVLKGEMSLVGPRPPIPHEVERYERWQRRRLSMRPGITCLWQISGRSQLDFDTWMKLDLQYIDQWSLALDAIILMKTIPAVLSTRGAA